MPKVCLLVLVMFVFQGRPSFVVHGPRPELSALARTGNATLRAGNLPKAEEIFRDGLRRARRVADLTYTSGFLTNLGVVRIQQSRYRQALEFFIQGQDAARQAGSAQSAGFAAFNIGVIYSRMGDWRRGHEAIVEATRGMDAGNLPSSLYLNLANYESRLKRYGEADRYFRLSIDTSERARVDSLVATAWEQWGLSYLERERLGPAERCLLESYRLHRLAKRPEAEQVHYGLARLALAQGDLDEARRRAAQYLRAARSAPLYYPLWEAYRIAAEIEERAGALPQAYRQYLRGVEWARRARAERLPSAQLMATAEAALQQLYLGLIRVAAEMNEAKPDPQLLLAALETAEEGRHAALAENSTRLTDEYWQTLDELQRTQARRLAEDTPQLARTTDAMRTKLINLESEAGLRAVDPASRGEIIRQARAELATDQALFVFRTGEPHSFLWTLTRGDVHLKRLPGELELKKLVATFRNETQSGHAATSEAGKKLFFEIFGEFSLRESTNQRWTLVPDGPLHELPFAALPWPTSDGMRKYLVEHRTLLMTPSVATIAKESGSVSSGPAFAGVADPIYNAADPRLAPVLQRADILGFFRNALPRPTFELARLPGSVAELNAAVATLHPANAIVLTGSQVNRQSFLALLDRQAETLHLATHVVPAPGDPRQALIALGMNPVTRVQELIGADEIHAQRHSARLVVLSGCGSGAGEALPGVGVMSLTRAWILSGATGVVASYWPVPDHSGALFERFYRHSPRAFRPRAKDWAGSLQQAQIESISQGIPASVWAAYFLTGRN